MGRRWRTRGAQSAVLAAYPLAVREFEVAVAAWDTTIDGTGEMG